MSEAGATARRWPRALAWLSFAALAGACAVAACARWHWFAEIVASFRWQLGTFGLLVPVALGLARRPVGAVAALALCLWSAWPELVLYVPRDEPAGDGPELELLVANVLFSNERRREVEATIRSVDPDVIALTEVSSPWRAMVDALGDRWSHRVEWPTDEPGWSQIPFGRVILSKHPLRHTVTPEIVERWTGTHEAYVSIGDNEVLLRNAHPPRPGGPWTMDPRNEALDALASAPWPRASILAGDLNTSGSSPYFADLLTRTGLRDTRAGHGRLASWSSPIPGMTVAVDHVLVGAAFDVLERETLEIPGSDHRGVVVRLRLRPVD